MNLATAFQAAVQRAPDKTALCWGDDLFSYARLWAQSVWMGAHLRDQCGVQPGDRVGLWLKNCPEFIPATFGALLAGGVLVPINNFLKAAEVDYILGDAETDLLITDSAGMEALAELRRLRPGLRVVEVAGLQDVSAGDPPPTAWPAREESDLAVIIYTSGTTGHPKGAMLSHGNLLHNVESIRLVLKLVGDDRFAVLLPLFHSYMLCVGLFAPLTIGGSIVLVKSLQPPRNAIAEILRHRASILPAIPQFYRAMVSSPLAGPLPLRVCVSGAAPLPVQVLDDFEAKFHTPLIEGYGLSEASPVVTKNPLNGTRKPGSIGLPIPNVEVSVQDDTGRPLPPREIGEICVRGGNVMQGYWRKPAETAATLRNGWLLTGDVGYQDEEGYFYITDRKKDMLLVNGINVYPREVEEVIHQYPGVKEAAVIGVPDARKGEQPIAWVAPVDGTHLHAHELHQFVRERLADYKVPRHIYFMPALPRNATGKILKTSLRELTPKH